ncbi:hypothetical protein FD755_025824 [Muntiacus reevesi]|uniref:CS domain-containing protein n=1 Tax=Muntiacus reevesi TaxID=9886 RepID=A0A5N3UIR4_MUNRE|nr:hypothetical protein FD755_025824 [Muntiacus reevesi]
MSAPFEACSGVVPCGTLWGQWYQTLEEVFIEVQVPPGTCAQNIHCGLQRKHVRWPWVATDPQGKSECAAHPWVQDQMQRELTLGRFQKENPGFDFSGTEISGNCTKGGPDFLNHEKYMIFLLHFVDPSRCCQRSQRNRLCDGRKIWMPS